jgi:hypothetical protein
VVAAGECDCVRIGWFDVLHSRRSPALYVLIHQRGFRPGPIAAAVLMVVACGAVAHAQPRKLTFDEAVSLATQHNSLVKIAGDKLKEIDARVQKARASYFPTLSNRRPSCRGATHRYPRRRPRCVPADRARTGWGIAGSGQAQSYPEHDHPLTTDHAVFQDPRWSGCVPRGCGGRPAPIFAARKMRLP